MGKDQASAEPVVVMGGTRLLAQDEPGLFDLGEVVSLALRPVHGVVPRFGGVAESEQGDGVRSDTALPEIIAGDLAMGVVGQDMVPALGDPFVDLQQRFLEMLALALPVVLAVFERNAGAFGQAPNRFPEIDPFEFLDEPENIAAFVTTEAEILKTENRASGIENL
jgi:hypothetical protein